MSCHCPDCDKPRDDNSFQQNTPHICIKPDLNATPHSCTDYTEEGSSLPSDIVEAIKWASGIGQSDLTKGENVKAIARAILHLVEENKEWGKSFEIYHDAQMRGIGMWQAKTGRVDTWPDTAYLTSWLIEELDRANGGHVWVAIPQLKLSQTCSKCGIIKRSDGRNNPCRGPVSISMRPVE